MLQSEDVGTPSKRKPLHHVYSTLRYVRGHLMLVGKGLPCTSSQLSVTLVSFVWPRIASYSSSTPQGDQTRGQCTTPPKPS